MSSVYQQCIKCILNTNDDPVIYFNKNGVCNHCINYDIQHKRFVFEGDEGEQALIKIVNKIKQIGKGKEYDCILGLSGGIDSTYTAYLAKKHGLRPLIVHLDNGWNSELAVKNIENIVNKLDFDLYTYVIDWEEFKDLQLAYLKASVVDIEAITDHAIITAMHKLAAKNKVKYIISGTNIVTEAVLPYAWIYNKMDSVNIKAIHKQFGKTPLKTFPLMDVWMKKYYFSFLKIETISILNYVSYIKEEVKKFITEELEWRDYGGKHYESIFTRFYQGYILPGKFKIDKRKAHLSTLICSGQITRKEALEEIKNPIYDPEQLKIDKEFVLKKLGLSEEEFEEIMSAPVRKHTDFKTEGTIYKHYPILKPLKPLIDLVKRN